MLFCVTFVSFGKAAPTLKALEEKIHKFWFLVRFYNKLMYAIAYTSHTFTLNDENSVTEPFSAKN